MGVEWADPRPRRRSTTAERLAVSVAERLTTAPQGVVVTSLLDLDDLTLARLLQRLSRAHAGRS